MQRMICGLLTAGYYRVTPRLLHVRPGLAVLIVNGYIGDFGQVKFLPGNARTFGVNYLEIPHFAFIAIVEVNLDAFTVRQRLASQHVFFPIVRRVRREKQLVDFDARLIAQREIMLAVLWKHGRHEN